MSAPRSKDSPFTQFLICMNGFYKSYDSWFNLFFKCDWVSPETSWTQLLFPSVTTLLLELSSYTDSISANCLYYLNSDSFCAVSEEM
jgi:hypothetical protein